MNEEAQWTAQTFNVIASSRSVVRASQSFRRLMNGTPYKESKTNLFLTDLDPDGGQFVYAELCHSDPYHKPFGGFHGIRTWIHQCERSLAEARLNAFLAGLRGEKEPSLAEGYMVANPVVFLRQSAPNDVYRQVGLNDPLFLAQMVRLHTLLEVFDFHRLGYGSIGDVLTATHPKFPLMINRFHSAVADVVKSITATIQHD